MGYRILTVFTAFSGSSNGTQTCLQRFVKDAAIGTESVTTNIDFEGLGNTQSKITGGLTC